MNIDRILAKSNTLSPFLIKSCLAKSIFSKINLILYIFIVWCSVWSFKFYGISTSVGYLIPNPVYTYIILILHVYDL